MEEMNHSAAQRGIAIACLTEICSDENAKHSDRIAAAKLLLEHSAGGESRELRVIMEDIPKEYLA